MLIALLECVSVGYVKFPVMLWFMSSNSVFKARVRLSLLLYVVSFFNLVSLFSVFFLSVTFFFSHPLSLLLFTSLFFSSILFLFSSRLPSLSLFAPSSTVCPSYIFLLATCTSSGISSPSFSLPDSVSSSREACCYIPTEKHIHLVRSDTSVTRLWTHRRFLIHMSIGTFPFFRVSFSGAWQSSARVFDIHVLMMQSRAAITSDGY